LDIDNADFNVNIGPDGEVFSFGNSFYKGDAPSALRKRDAVEPVTALKTAVNTLQLPVKADNAKAESKGDDVFALKETSGAVSEPEARLVYVQTAEGNLALAWRVETDVNTNWLLTYVDAEDGEKIHHVVDYAADASYEVYPWGLNDPTEGSRVVLEDPWTLRRVSSVGTATAPQPTRPHGETMASPSPTGTTNKEKRIT